MNSRKEIKEAVDFAFKQDSQVRSYILKLWKFTDVEKFNIPQFLPKIAPIFKVVIEPAVTDGIEVTCTVGFLFVFYDCVGDD